MSSYRGREKESGEGAIFKAEAMAISTDSTKVITESYTFRFSQREGLSRSLRSQGREFSIPPRELLLL